MPFYTRVQFLPEPIRKEINSQHDFAGGNRDEAHNGLSGDAFAATGFADDTKHLSFFEEKGNIVDGGGRAFKGEKTGFEFFDIE